ncbi:hypothetical protein JCM33374_g5501 [Metschnikowia sp. JCM 33374]|nr:hypothetical protein JCM33374_g5501 [Metschnikowia sp. JCM 33374]
MQKTSSLISGPSLLPAHDPHATHPPNTSEISSPLSPKDLNSSQGKRSSRIFFPSSSSEGQENTSKRHSLTWRKRSSSPSSELTLATLSVVPSDMTSVESLSVDLPSPTIAENEEYQDSIEELDMKHLQYTQYADFLDLDEPCIPTKIHRTTNIGDIRKLIQNDDMLPISNRKSLEYEEHEIQMHRSRICGEDDNSDCEVQLVENAFVMTFFSENLEPMRFWDDIDIHDALKHDTEEYEKEGLSLSAL